MGAGSLVGWTHDTANGWHGCEKVSQGCKHCYAEVSTPVRVKRARGLELWGAAAARSETQEWERDLRKWNREAASGQVRRVFAQSLSDTFEDYHGGAVVRADGSIQLTLDDLRARFLAVIGDCTALTIQLLTKRPENIPRMVPPAWLESWPAHVWIGCTVEDQENAELRIPHLLAVPASVRFLSVEPQIGPVDLARVSFRNKHRERITLDALTGDWEWDSGCGGGGASIAWVICGGEFHRDRSKARPFDLVWARSLRAQCRAAGVPYFLKRLGARPFDTENCDLHKPPRCDSSNKSIALHLVDSHGADESEWPSDLRGCRAFPGSP